MRDLDINVVGKTRFGYSRGAQALQRAGVIWWLFFQQIDSMAFDVPILFCVFNRPELTRSVFEVIARQKPKRLLVACDGPRPDHPDDESLVRQTRAIFDDIDWECDVQLNFSDTNNGCRKQMANAITWGFEQNERLIILEDDCLPNDSFFTFCRQMLIKYRQRQDVMIVSGNNYPQADGFDHDYRFSKYPLIWGWASWRRAWQRYDLEMELWDLREVREHVLNNFTENPDERAFWQNIFDHQRAGKIDTWDYSFTFACWAHNGLSILPRVNLVTNIGFGDQATHTFDPQSPMANQKTFELTVSDHPTHIQRVRSADRKIREIVFEPPASARVEKPVRVSKSLMKRLLGLSLQKIS